MGLYFDKKLTFKKHVEKLKAKCQKGIHLLRSLCGEELGADTLMNVYRALVRAQLGYGAIVYNSAPIQVLNQLQPVVNESLELRREELTLKCYFKMRSHIRNPAHPCTVTPKQELLFQNKKLPAPFAVRARNIMVKYDINRGFVRTVFSYRLLNIIEPTWSIEAPEVSLEMTELPKSNTTDHVYQALLNEVRASKYSNSEQMYTDEAKSETGVGAAVVWRNTGRTTALPKHATIYTAEMHAVKLALDVVAEQRMLKSVIFQIRIAC